MKIVCKAFSSQNVEQRLLLEEGVVKQEWLDILGKFSQYFHISESLFRRCKANSVGNGCDQLDK